MGNERTSGAWKNTGTDTRNAETQKIARRPTPGDSLAIAGEGRVVVESEQTPFLVAEEGGRGAEGEVGEAGKVNKAFSEQG
ncbi:MAG: hypothetical protein AAFX78_02785 [Cyanobacteria bacterium J06638_20]